MGKPLRLLCCMLWILLAGCTALEPAGTPTPHTTLLAIARMLTQTGAAPTATRTPTIAPSKAVTPSATVEIPVSGSEKLPVPVSEPLLFASGAARLTITSIQSLALVGEQTSPEGQIYLDMELVIENLSSASVAYNRVDFRLVDPAENDHSAAEVGQSPAETEHFPVDLGAGPLLRGGQLPPGEIVRGHVAFLTQTPASTFTIHFRPSGAEAAGEDWWITGQIDSALASGPGPAQPWPPLGVSLTGQAVEQEGIALEVAQTQIVPRLSLGKPPDGMRYVALEVVIENTTRAKTPFNALYFRIKDAQGYEYIPILGAPEESLQPGSLSEGQSVRGTVFFTLPVEMTQGLVTYQPGVLFEEYPQLRIGVEIPSASR